MLPVHEQISTALDSERKYEEADKGSHCTDSHEVATSPEHIPASRHVRAPSGGPVLLALINTVRLTCQTESRPASLTSSPTLTVLPGEPGPFVPWAQNGRIAS
jgi:hypothetical protein